MTHIYTGMGSVPAWAKTRRVERTDPLLRWTGDAARKMMRSVKGLPVAQQVAQIDAALARLDATLPAKVRRVGATLRADGLATEKAVERALSLSLADGIITHIKGLGTRQASPLMGLRGLGTTSTNPGDIVASTLQGVICSQGLQSAITDLVGRNEGRDAANATGVGFGVGAGLAQCSTLTTPPVPPPAPATETSNSLLLPVVVGIGAVAAVGVVLWMTNRKKAAA